MILNQSWIGSERHFEKGDCPVFVKKFIGKGTKKGTVTLTAKGNFCLFLNKKRVMQNLLAPGYTQYTKRLQYHEFDLTEHLSQGENTLEVYLSAGWYAGRIAKKCRKEIEVWEPEIIGEILLSDKEGKKTVFGTDESWQVGTGPLLFSDIYDGEIFDAAVAVSDLTAAVKRDSPKDILISAEGPEVAVHEILSPTRIFTTPKGETVLDFGQNLTGWPLLRVRGKKGDEVSLSFGEILDKDGNFYNENYRKAKCNYRYFCKDGEQEFAPLCTFYGFRYVRVDAFPKNVPVTKDSFRAAAVHSRLVRTGRLSSSDERVNKLFSNILWGQKSNFLDIPTDCPQRDERLGWTGDAQAFCKTACYQFNCLAFFRKWLRDMHAQWEELGYVAQFVPGGEKPMAAGWSDAAVLVPWYLYRRYGDRSILEENLDMMIGHVDTIAKTSLEEYAWRGGENLRQFGDWLATDSAENDKSGAFITTSHSGATDPDFLQSAFYALDVELIAKTLSVLGKDPSRYLRLHEKIKARFEKDHPAPKTQTECAVALCFGLTSDPEGVTEALCRLIEKNGGRMSTGFIGTPYLLHALSENGKAKEAWDLFLQTEYPSWLYCVSLGATTMWEHWDGVDEKGEMWNATMNSFNHYAYGAVADWVYEAAAGIGQRGAGFEYPVIRPHPTSRLDWLEATLDTRKGKIRSKWTSLGNGLFRYEITLPVKGSVILNGKETALEKGEYVFEC